MQNISKSIEFIWRKGQHLLYTDIITPGWSAEGNRFSYDRLQLINEIYLDGALVVYDHIKLTPADQKIEGTWIHGRVLPFRFDDSSWRKDQCWIYWIGSMKQ